LNSELKLSISHSRSVLLMTLGEQEQGCDIEFVENRSDEEWKDLLDHKYSHVIDQLIPVDNDYNVSATRIWCVREAMIKSTGSIQLGLTIEKISGKAVIFKVITGGQKETTILTFPVNALPNNTAVISMIMELKADDTPSQIHVASKTGSYAIFNSQEGCFTHNFFTTFKDCKGFFGKTHFTNFPAWMGSLRELVLAPIGNELLRDLGSGEYGMVTNASDIRILNEADTLNDITANLWITDKSDLPNSFIDLNFEFFRKNAETGEAMKLAKCNLSTTWVKIEGRGIVKQSPIPAYFLSFLNQYIRTNDRPKQYKNGSLYPGMKDVGRVLFEDPSAVRPKHVILEKTFQTGISNGNAVGNLYYSNYYDWQSKVIEQYLYKLAPGLMLQSGKEGEFLTIESHVNHLQEAMPFEDISTCIFLDKIFENGLKFYFEYYSVKGIERRKLAYGSNTLVWSKRVNDRSMPVVTGLPKEIMADVKSLIMA
jgi:enediyne polyketide synthase